MSRESGYDIGIIGLGVMGRNLLLNLADHGFSAAGYDKDPEKVNSLENEAKNRNIKCMHQLDSFISVLKKPRAIILLVPAGPAVDSVIKEISIYLQKDDLLIDSGNSYFKDTDLRIKNLADDGIHFMGMGISGGAEGARNGASIMPGGPKNVYERIKPLLEAIAAKAFGEYCVAWMGPHSAGHFVKMVHNGIEYGLMQLISETYALLKLLSGFSDDQLAAIYKEWNNNELNAFLIEIAGNIFSVNDEKTGKRLIDKILDVSRQKGTGMWTSQSAMELQVPVPNIDVAVSMRNLSVYEEERKLAAGIYRNDQFPFEADSKKFPGMLKNSLYLSMMITYAQGFSLLNTASEKYGYGLDLFTISGIWRGGCIIRSAMLNDIREAFRRKPDLRNTLLDSKISQLVISHQDDLRQIVNAASSAGIAVPGFMSALAYFDSYRSSWLPANLIQAQRDYFGGHTYERNDSKGTYHTEWIKKLA